MPSLLSTSPGAYLAAFQSKHVVLVDFWWLFLLGLLVAFVQYKLSVPADLRHLPTVSPYATILSYARRESVDSRVKRLVMPFARRGEGVVLVYMLGKWGIHVLDANVCAT